MTEASRQRDDLLAHVVQKAYDEYRQAPTLPNFLKSIEAIGARDHVGIVLAGWWAECPPVTQAPMTELLTWLARLKPWRALAEHGRLALEVHENSAVYKRAREIGRTLAEVTMGIRHIAAERRRIAENRYGAFWAAYVFEEALTKHFGRGDDPALAVRGYLEAFFPVETRSDPSFVKDQTALQSVVVSAEVAEFLQATVLPWALAMNAGGSQETRLPKQQSQFLARTLIPLLLNALNAWDRTLGPQPFGYEELARCLPLVPQAMFERLLAWAIELADAPPDGAAWWRPDAETWDLADVVLGLPLGGPAEAGQLGLPKGNMLRDFVEDHDLGSHVVPAVPVAYLGSIIWEMAEWACDWAVLGPLLAAKIDALLHRPEWEGRSPWSAEESASVGVALEVVAGCAATPWRLHVTLEWNLQSPPQDKFLYAGPIGIDPPTGPEQRRSRLELGIALANAIADDGWDEFANAYLAFLLFTQVAIPPNQLECDFSSLEHCLRRLRGRPGHHWVERAMTLVLGELERTRSGGPFRLLFRSWYPSTDQSEIGPGFPDLVVSNAVIHADLLEKIGSECYLRLPGDAKKSLVDAERNWTLLHREIGTGYGDYGALVVSYVKVVEVTLKTKLWPVLTSRAYEDYSRATRGVPDAEHVTLGPMLHLAKKFETLPPRLRTEFLAAGARLQDDRALVGKLLSILVRRNEGAHTAKRMAAHAIAVRSFYYEENGLKRLLDLLP